MCKTNLAASWEDRGLRPAEERAARRAWRCARWVLAICALFVGTGNLARGQAPALTEYQVKALFLMNFTKYVEWPANVFTSTNAPICIGVYGENKFGDELQKAVAGKSVGGRNIIIRQFDSPNGLAQCQILFISGSEKNHLPEVLAPLRGRPVLTVGETDNFCQQGGLINFAMKAGKVRLEINLTAAKQAGLQLSARLLGVADVVKGK